MQGQGRLVGRIVEILVPAVPIGEPLLFEVGQQERAPAVVDAILDAGRTERPFDPTRRESAVRVFKVVQGQADVLQIAAALNAVGGLAYLLHRRQQDADEHSDDGEHHQQLDQREGAAAPTADLYLNLGHRSDSPWQNRESHFSATAVDSGSGGVFQIFTIPSRLAEASHSPSGLKATLSTQLVWP